MPYSTFIISLISILVVIIIISFAIFYLLRKSTNNSDQQAIDGQLLPTEGGNDSVKSYLPTLYLQLRLSFIKALRQLKTHVGDRDYIYKIPWFLTIGEPRSG